MAMNTVRLGPNQRRALQLLQAAPAGMTRTELQRQLAIPDLRTMQTMLKALRGRGLIHIGSWCYESAGASCPACRVFVAGPGTDAPKPAALGREACRRRYRDRIGRQLYNHVNEARKRGAARLVVDGVTVWQRGAGFTKNNVAKAMLKGGGLA
ncbi:hypothetical protein [Chromobacterium violaceum]|uniref:Uncharacterized protein n=1 Tax=Chromobacterium violaceum TaxID=536 RepID=A0A202B574_CHRVL|nr:hypothetical protein [Chromobacterium violaceum]OVE46726.1 hypothetical protein CBW21_17680 [Chromobacterium violaceum]